MTHYSAEASLRAHFPNISLLHVFFIYPVYYSVSLQTKKTILVYILHKYSRQSEKTVF